ncbi:hypothetical protein RRG08_064236 [Elysia crispata]|uniref:Uncharacterized protein n=1 Tax=Elysia crispata TaxID=231223 RepID=A0AAE0YG29_9GAST|nr:hypothetical protein RRG08_064236 [Elysia crispata]
MLLYSRRQQSDSGSTTHCYMLLHSWRVGSQLVLYSSSLTRDQRPTATCSYTAGGLVHSLFDIAAV